MSWRSCALLSLLIFRQSWAWSGEGHFQIALVAQGYLREKLRKKVKELLKGDLVDFAHYEQKLTVPETSMCHFHHQKPEWQCGQGIGHNGKVHCDGSEAGYFSLHCAVSLTFQKFAYDALMQEYPKSDFFRMPVSDYWSNFKKLPEAAHYSEMLKTPEDELRWLAIFIGDMHQPLHWLRGDFEYGKNITVVAKGKEYSLFEYWESQLPLDFQLNDFHGDPRMYKKWHHFKEHPGEIFANWGSELSNKACDLYAALPDLRQQQRVELNTETIRQWRKLYESLVLQAGERLAQVMSELLTHRKHEAGHKNGRGLHHPRVSSTKNLMTNLLLAIPTVLLWLVGLHFHYHRKMPSFSLASIASAAPAPREHRKE